MGFLSSCPSLLMFLFDTVPYSHLQIIQCGHPLPFRIFISCQYGAVSHLKEIIVIGNCVLSRPPEKRYKWALSTVLQISDVNL